MITSIDIILIAASVEIILMLGSWVRYNIC